MSPGAGAPARRGLAAAALGAALLLGSAFAWADGEAGAGGGEADRPKEGFQEWVEGHRPAQAVGLGLRVLGLAGGVAFVVRALLRRDRVRGGLLPPPPPPEPTLPTTPLAAFGLALLAFAAPGVLSMALAAGGASGRVAGASLEMRLAIVAAAFVPLACFVVLRRWRLRAERAGGAAPPPPGLLLPRGGAEPPSVPRALFEGLGACCVALLLVVPLFLLTAFAYRALGLDPEVQPLLDELRRPAAAWHPWLVAVFAILPAPFAEEAIYRGLLYPAARASAGGGRRGFWVGAVVTSALFAAMHNHGPSLPALFALAMVLAWTFEKTNSLLACFVAHALFNLGTLVPVLVRLYA